MIECRECGCNCDPGDLVNGLCDDCRESEEKKEMPRMSYGGCFYGNNEKTWQPGRVVACQV